MTNSIPGLFVSENNEKKKFKINGFRFFQESLVLLRKEVKEYSSLGHKKPLDASAVAMYIGLFSQCNHAGVIPSDLHITSISSMLNLHRSTGSNGMHQLIERGLVTERISDKGTEYEITDYHENNMARENPLSTKALNYFTIPFELLHTTVLANLVSKKTAKGIILMLEIFNNFRHKLKFEKVSPIDFKYELTTKVLMEKLGKSSAKRAREVIDVLSPIFNFKPVGITEKKPRDLLTRVRKPSTQLCIHKYEIRMTPGCVVEKEAFDIEAIKATKDADYRIKLLGLTMYTKDKKGIRAAYKGNVKEIANFVKDKNKKKSLLRDSMQHALESLEEFILKGHKSNNIGGFINSKLQEFVFGFIDKNAMFSDLVHNYHLLEAAEPKILLNYRKFKNKPLA